MDNNSIHTTVPQLRFPDFANDGEWEKDAFENTFLFLPNNTLSRAELNYEKGSTKNVHYGDVLIKFGDCLDVQTNVLPFISDEAIADKLQRSRLQDGDVVIADTAEDETVGKCTEIFNISGENVVSGLHTIPVRPKKQFAIPYLGFYFNSDSYRKQLLPLMQGVKVMSISKTAISKTIVAYPNLLSEQCKIGSCFSSMDAYISATKAKLELLKTYKKGLMQKLFPAKGKKMPELRFKEFEKDGEWEEKKLGEIVGIYDGIHQTPNYTNKGVMFVSVEDISTLKSNKFISEEDFYRDFKVYPQRGNILMTRIGDIGTANVYDSDELLAFYVSLALFKPKSINSYFLKHTIDSYYFQYQLSIKTLHIAFPQKINKTELESILVYCPSVSEQRKIADCLTSIDEMINQYSNKIALLKQYKKGLMQQMFPTSK